MKANVSRATLVAVYAIAISADLIEIGFAPFFPEGGLFPPDDVLDAVVCLILTRLIGFHVAFLPSFFIKLIPFVEIAPTWTIAVLIATRHLRAPGANAPPVVDVSATVTAEPPRESK